MGIVHWIYDDHRDTVSEGRTTAPNLKEMQDFVGGYVEHVTVLFEGKRADMWVHEIGRQIFPKRNEEATQVYFAASRARGVDPEDLEASHRETEAMAAKMGMKPEQIHYVGEGDGKPVGIYGPAIITAEFPQEF